jgi:hypothetical protein
MELHIFDSFSVGRNFPLMPGVVADASDLKRACQDLLGRGMQGLREGAGMAVILPPKHGRSTQEKEIMP